MRSTQWCSWLRYCATNRKASGSIPDGAIEIFHWHNPSGRNLALWLTQPLTEMSTMNISLCGGGGGGLRRSVRRADNLTTFMCRVSWIRGASTSWNTMSLSRPVRWLLYLYLYYLYVPAWRCKKNLSEIRVIVVLQIALNSLSTILYSMKPIINYDNSNIR
jgi:hypothetical protein